VQVIVKGFMQTTCVRICAIKELALFLDLILRKVDLVHYVQITCLVRGLALWLCAQEQDACKKLQTNKEGEEEFGGRSPTLG
jgi:hypothetical protein